MNYFFVDYENVGSEGLNGIDKLDEENIVCIFYSKNANKITFELHVQLIETRAKIEYHNIDALHKNALDFQLSSYLGYIIRENEKKDCNYFIVSKDTGFESLINFWEKYKNVKIELVINILRNKNQPSMPERELENKVIELTNDKANASAIAKIISTSKTKVEVNNSLNKLFKSSKCGEVYKAIKILISDKKSN